MAELNKQGARTGEVDPKLGEKRPVPSTEKTEAKTESGIPNSSGEKAKATIAKTEVGAQAETDNPPQYAANRSSFPLPMYGSASLKTNFEVNTIRIDEFKGDDLNLRDISVIPPSLDHKVVVKAKKDGEWKNLCQFDWTGKSIGFRWLDDEFGGKKWPTDIKDKIKYLVLSVTGPANKKNYYLLREHREFLTKGGLAGVDGKTVTFEWPEVTDLRQAEQQSTPVALQYQLDLSFPKGKIVRLGVSDPLLKTYVNNKIVAIVESHFPLRIKISTSEILPEAEEINRLKTAAKTATDELTKGRAISPPQRDNVARLEADDKSAANLLAAAEERKQNLEDFGQAKLMVATIHDIGGKKFHASSTKLELIP